MNHIIDNFATQNGIIAGICDGAKLCLPSESILLDAPFITRDLSLRLDPKMAFTSVKSVIVVGVGHNWICKPPNDNKLRGRISRHAIGIDYHIAVSLILESLAGELKIHENFNYKILVDNNPLCERALAVKAGLGYIGRNRAVTSEKFGSYFNIGIMLTDLELKPGIPSNKSCPDNCNECIKACPGGALSKDGFDYRKCVSYLTQKKGVLSKAEESAIGSWIYGCDVCQEVCPANRGVAVDITCTESLMPVLEDLINMDEDAFKQRFENSALYWRGKKTLSRNAECAKRNVKNGILEL